MTRAYDLSHILWLGGSPCAGKSSVRRLLTERHDLVVYIAAGAFPAHAARLDPTRQPALTGWLQASWDERWMQPVDDLVTEAIACYTEHWGFILEDVTALSNERPTLVEGTALLPREVARLGVPPQRALWLTPTAEFQYQHYAQRDWMRDIVAQCSQPQVAFTNWMARDAQFARWVEDEARRLGYEVIVVDGAMPIEAMAQQVARHFGLNDRGETAPCRPERSRVE